MFWIDRLPEPIEQVWTGKIQMIGDRPTYQLWIKEWVWSPCLQRFIKRQGLWWQF